LVELRASLDASLASLSSSSDLTLERVFDLVIDPLLALYASRAGILRVCPRQHGHVSLARIPGVHIEEVISRLQALLALHEPAFPPEQRQICAEIIMHTVRALLPLTVALDGAPRREMVSELKRLVRAYVCGARADDAK
jgi:hypothetical protein